MLWIVFAGRRLIEASALWLAALLAFACALVLVADIVYCGQAGKHLGFEFRLFFANTGAISQMLVRDYGWALIAVFLAGLLHFYSWRCWFSLRQDALRGWTWRVAAAVLFILLSVIAFRGGLQERPLRPADAYQHLAPRFTDFALNGVYTAFYALYHGEALPGNAGQAEIASARRLVAGPGEKFLHAELPFYRHSATPGAMLRKNVVFIILESWSARRVGVLGDTTGATPFFDSLAKKGRLYTNAFATGRRSIASLPSAISSIPTLFGALYITSPYEQNFQRGMGTIFVEKGYATFFTYAAHAGSMGFNAYARLAGFDHIVTRESFPAGSAHDGTWGIYDHVMFARVADDLRAVKQPFVSVIYTLHPHPPFRLPPGNDFFPAGHPRREYYNALRYSDNTLRDFFTAAERELWFKDTVFVLMADHAFEDTQGLDAFRIPLLFYSPGFIPPERHTAVASELDVLPTLVDLLKIDTAHAAMGRSLLAPGERMALVDAEHSAGIIRSAGGRLLALMFAPEGYTHHFDMQTDPEWKTPLRDRPFPAAEMVGLKSYVDAMGFAIRENRIAPRLNRMR